MQSIPVSNLLHVRIKCYFKSDLTVKNKETVSVEYMAHLMNSLGEFLGIKFFDYIKVLGKTTSHTSRETVHALQVSTSYNQMALCDSNDLPNDQ